MFLATVALALASSVAQDVSSRSEPCALPASLRAALQSRFGSSRVLGAADLYEDERALFRADHPGACPGIKAGRFFGAAERPAVAVILLGVGPSKGGRLIVARPAMTTWILTEVDELREGSTAVVGSESGIKQGDKTAPDVLVLRAYEAWKRSYLWNGRAFEPTPPRG